MGRSFLSPQAVDVPFVSVARHRCDQRRGRQQQAAARATLTFHLRAAREKGESKLSDMQYIFDTQRVTGRPSATAPPAPATRHLKRALCASNGEPLERRVTLFKCELVHVLLCTSSVTSFKREREHVNANNGQCESVKRP